MSKPKPPELFTKDKDDLMIELIRAQPSIFDPYHEHFKNVVEKHKVWERISATLEIPDVKKRWRHFRDQYVKKLKLHSVGLLRQCKPWEYMKKLNFLAHVGIRRMTLITPDVSTIDDASSHHSSDSEELDQQWINLPCPQFMNKKRKYSGDMIDPPPDKASKPQPVPTPPQERSTVHKFFDSMADVVVQFPPQVVADIRLKVCQLVTDTELLLHTEWLDAPVTTVEVTTVKEETALPN